MHSLEPFSQLSYQMLIKCRSLHTETFHKDLNDVEIDKTNPFNISAHSTEMRDPEEKGKAIEIQWFIP